MCDAGTINTTEPNALRDMIEVEGFMDKLLGNLNLPTMAPFGTSFGGSTSNTSSILPQNTPALPWRRANVRHTSNELYADVVETLSVTLAPSGRPLAAFANGTIAFTSKISGVPDILVTLTGPSGKHNLKSLIDLPVFHPCVRLAKWREQPGLLSFIPPDGRFTLAGYEVDLLPFTDGKPSNSANLKLPVTLEIKTGLGSTASDFEVRLQLHKLGIGSQAARRGGGGGGGGGGGSGPLSASPQPGTPASPSIHDVVVTVPLPADVRNLPEIRPSKGDATYNPGDRVLEWTISNKELAQGISSYYLRCTVVGQLSGDEEGEDAMGFGFNASGGRDYSYDDGKPYQAASKVEEKEGEEEKAERKTAQNKILMPSSASVSFAVKGWLPSGLKVESIIIDPRKSRGLNENLKPYKGVKYLTVSKGGVEVRC